MPFHRPCALTLNPEHHVASSGTTITHRHHGPLASLPVGFVVFGDRNMQHQNSTQQAPFRFIDIKEVTRMVGWAKSTVLAWVKEGSFPRQVKIGSSARWVDTEVIQWMEDRRSERR